MFLINVETMQLEYFQGNIPNYAILSHTWGDDELLYKDMIKFGKTKHWPVWGDIGATRFKNRFKKMKGRAGWTKVRAACHQAREDGLQYIWVDTCCINKESSAELSEAINSMYDWYQKSYICYAYLTDVPDDDDPTIPDSAFWNSRWFTRGWTLQELLAPSSLVFYGTKWHEIGTKASLQPTISAITGIQSSVILTNHGGEVSIATRMSWAAGRSTTREEDIAYCLMGLFGVQMPLLYGEGQNAFIRLQYEIIKLSDDHSIFAWLPDSDGERGLLAHHPREFAHSRHISNGDSNEATPYSVTNKGIRIELPLLGITGQEDTFYAPLNCTGGGDRRIAILLKRENGQQFARPHFSEFREVPQETRKSEILFVKERDPSRFDISSRMRPKRLHICSVGVKLPSKFNFGRPQGYPPEFWVEGRGGDWVLSMKHGSGTSGSLVFTDESADVGVAFTIGVHNHSVWSDVLILTANQETPQNIRDSYYTSRSGALWKNRDRSSTTSNGLIASVSIKKVLLQQEEQLSAIIEIKAGSKLTRWVQPGDIQYTFWVTVSVTCGGYTVSEALPPKGDESAYWEAYNGSKILCLRNSGISGILLFENESEKFAVTIGIHNYRVWSDIVTNVKQETAHAIWRSYYTDGGRGGKLWEWCRQCTADLAEGSVSLDIKNNRFDDHNFRADICVRKK